jgi:hypothetical protein
MMESRWTDRAKNEEIFHEVKEERNILHTIKQTRLITSCAKTTLYTTLLKERLTGREDEEGDVISYLKISRKRKHTENLKVALSEDFAMEESMDLY